MSLILLTGAGFSRNWNGWLANEAFEYLLGCQGMTPRISRFLWQAHKNGGGFEAVYQHLRDEIAAGSPPDDFKLFHQMVVGMFHTMQIGFRHADVNGFHRRFLARFDEIYTLNQDTLLELHYFPEREGIGQEFLSLSNGTFFNVQTPGLRPAFEQRREPVNLFTPDASNLAVKERHQPYYKLHGSSNWIQPGNDDQIVILGGEKELNIARTPLLQHYFAVFERAITQPDTKLIIIGYSFSDAHVNRRLFAAAHAGTKIFIVDPNGTDTIQHLGEKLTMANVELMNPIQELKDAIVGASRRPLKSSIEGDDVERTKLHRFMDGMFR